jgi:hypothetical protein
MMRRAYAKAVTTSNEDLEQGYYNRNFRTEARTSTSENQLSS